MRPPVKDNVRRVNGIISLRLDRLIDHNLEDLVDVPIQLSLSQSPLSLVMNDFASMDATNGNPIDSSPSRPTDLVAPTETRQDKPKEENESTQPSTIMRVHKPIAPFSNRIRNEKDHPHVDKIRDTFSQAKINISLLDAIH